MTQEEKDEKAQESSTEKNDTEEVEGTESGETAEDGEKTSSVPYERFQEVVKERNKLRKQMEGKEAKEVKKESSPEKPESQDEWREWADFRIRNKDVSEDEADLISTIAKGKGISMDEAYKQKSVKDYISWKRKEAEDENAAPTPSYKGETFNKKPIHEVSDEERKSNFKELAQKAIKEGKARKRKDLGL